MLTREKQRVEAPNPQTETTPLRGIGEDAPYLQSFALPCETPTTYAYHPQLIALTMGFLKLQKPLDQHYMN